MRQLDIFGWARSRGLLPYDDISLTTKHLKQITLKVFFGFNKYTYEESYMSVLDIINTAWPILLGFITLVIVLAKMHTAIEVLQEKVKTLFDLHNKDKS